MSSKRGLKNHTGEKLGGRAAAIIQASAALRSSRKDPLRTLISYSKVTKVRSLGSGHKNSGFSDATRACISGTRVQERCIVNINTYEHKMRQ